MLPGRKLQNYICFYYRLLTVVVNAHRCNSNKVESKNAKQNKLDKTGLRQRMIGKDQVKPKKHEQDSKIK